MPHLIVANWKMGLTKVASTELAAEIATWTIGEESLVICPSVLFTDTIAQVVAGSCVQVGAQDCANKQLDAFTGGVGAKQLAEIGCKYCIIGHSERRLFAHETPQEIHDKLELLLEYNITPILCVGEDHISRKAGSTREVIAMQLEELDFGLNWNKVIVTYEPIWAIGTGIVPNNHEIEEVIEVILSQISAQRVLYGGSVNGSNISELSTMKKLDGFLVGSASTKPEELKTMLNIVTKNRG
jgi:triosephosphate isomerase